MRQSPLVFAKLTPTTTWVITLTNQLVRRLESLLTLGSFGVVHGDHPTTTVDGDTHAANHDIDGFIRMMPTKRTSPGIDLGKNARLDSRARRNRHNDLLIDKRENGRSHALDGNVKSRSGGNSEGTPDLSVVPVAGADWSPTPITGREAVQHNANVLCPRPRLISIPSD